ncbi:MAG: hypothetical protein GX605_05020 [Chloroflexi bacterium]|nr:hypothetical protein [Chloroflexota bacterium]
MVELHFERGVSDQLFWAVRRKATREILWGKLRRAPADCLSFETVRVALGLTFRMAEGLQNVPLDLIIGSVSRHRDFTRHFYPARDDLHSRWMRVAIAMQTTGLGPVSLYRIGEAYFVDDGNHRVSVARAMGTPTIEAEVWRFPCRVSPPATLRMEELPCLAAHVQFLRETNLDAVRPHQEVRMTACDRYSLLAAHIAGHAQWLESRSPGRPVPLGEAVASWYDRVFQPMLEIIRAQRLESEFPHLTGADLYALLLEHRKDLALIWDRPVSLTEAIQDYVRHYGRSPGTRLKRWLRYPWFLWRGGVRRPPRKTED